MKYQIYADQIKMATLAYWRYVKKHPVGGIEVKDADVLSITRAYMLTETEVKVSIADMQREIKTKRYKHSRMFGEYASLYPMAHYFYFAVPEEIQEKALVVINERYPYAGLLVYVDGEIDVYSPRNIKNVRLAKRLKRKPLGQKELFEIAYGVSNTAMRYINQRLLGAIK